MIAQTPADTLDPENNTHVALVADLDGTLCRTDTLHEAILALIVRSPLALLKLPGWLSEGRAGLKARLADQGVLDPELLPMNDAVIEALRVARSEGRPTALVSAADHRQVTAIAEATGLFDEAYGSAENRNLKGATKAEFLIQHFGEKQFDYMGDAHADLPVWAAARNAITVGAGQSLRHAAKGANAQTFHIDPPGEKWRSILKAMRPHQWSKNLLLFLPMLAAHDLSRLPQVFLGFLAFCMTASAVYVINDLTDLEADRLHPRKRKRPFAAGDLMPLTGVILTAGLLFTALVLALMMPDGSRFLGVLLLYLFATFAYSLWLKRKLVVDVLMLAGLYTVRIIAGVAAASVVLSQWMLAFAMFLFLALAAVKRQAELTDQAKTGRASAGRAYEVDDLPVLRSLALSAGNAAVLVLALYISSDAVQQLYNWPELLWMICPMLLYWIVRMVMKTHRGLMTDDPIVYAATDPVSLFIVAMMSALVVIGAI